MTGVAEPLPAELDRALAPLDPTYGGLLARAIAAAKRDERIRALWIGGSIARGVADEGSDLDLLIAVDDDRFDAFAAQWRGWLASITDVLFARELPGLPGSFFATTTECCRLDVVVERAGGLATTPYRRRIVAFDPHGLHQQIPPPLDDPGPDVAEVERIVEEIYRQQAIFPAAVVARRDWLLGIVAVHNLQVLLYQLFVACNAPLPPMGVKQWSSRLSSDQRSIMRRLPQPEADGEAVVVAMLAVRAAIRGGGRQAAESAGASWPTEADARLSAYWERAGLIDSGS